MKCKFKYVLGAFVCVLCGCDTEEIPTFAVEDSSVYFTRQKVEFSFRESEDKQTGTINIPVMLMGPSTDYDRPMNVVVITDSVTTATKSDYTMTNTVLKASEGSTTITLSVPYTSQLDTEKKTLLLGLFASDHFIDGVPGNRFCTVEWSNMLTMPLSWRSWWYFFCDTYSTRLHELVLEVIGEDAYLLNTWGEKGKDENGVSYPRTSQDQAVAMSRKLAEHVRQYKIDHPNKPLMHGEDGVKYSNYNKVSGPAPNTEIVIRTR